LGGPQPKTGGGKLHPILIPDLMMMMMMDELTLAWGIEATGLLCMFN